MQPENLEELISANDNRKTIYRFLARIYARELTDDSLKELAKQRDLFLSLAQVPEIRGTEIAEGFMTVAEFVSKLNEQDLSRVLLELAAEYAGLFLGVRKVPPHPSESAYENPEHLIMQKPRDDVLEIYRNMGLEKTRDFPEPEDHVAIELQFMGHLCEKTNAALNEGSLQDAKKCLEVQRDFLDEHLGNWVPQLVTDILKSVKVDFYKGVAKITRGYIETDKKVVEELMDALASSPTTNRKESQT